MRDSGEKGRVAPVQFEGTAVQASQMHGRVCLWDLDLSICFISGQEVKDKVELCGIYELPQLASSYQSTSLKDGFVIPPLRSTVIYNIHIQ
jgi:hypothetical protein